VSRESHPKSNPGRAAWVVEGEHEGQVRKRENLNPYEHAEA
jgi:hypothetical protein